MAQPTVRSRANPALLPDTPNKFLLKYTSHDEREQFIRGHGVDTMYLVILAIWMASLTWSELRADNIIDGWANGTETAGYAYAKITQTKGGPRAA